MMISPDHYRAASGENALMITGIAYLVLHDEAGAAHVCYTDAHLGTICSYKGKLEGAGDFFDEQAIMISARSCLDAWIMRFLALLLLLLLFSLTPLTHPRSYLI